MGIRWKPSKFKICPSSNCKWRSNLCRRRKWNTVSLLALYFNSHVTSGEKCVEIVKTLHVKFFPFGCREPSRNVTVKFYYIEQSLWAINYGVQKVKSSISDCPCQINCPGGCDNCPNSVCQCEVRTEALCLVIHSKILLGHGIKPRLEHVYWS